MGHASQRSSSSRPSKSPQDPNGPAPRRPNLQVLKNERFNGRKLLALLEAENAELRDHAVELLLQIQALRSGDQALTA